ncbi:MAG: DUF3086 domain-containing protein [Coleofasciculus sp. G1-WW12-02]|uniref:DUF3086 domain-containing protein n=1 Tax=unclassified Coleofasciculus TaxID=2692782 RepID=UPI0032F5BA18
MNSDEPQSQESNPEQQPILEVFDEKSPEQKPETEKPEPLIELSDQSDVTQPQADNSKALDLPAPDDDNQMTPSSDQQETVANFTQRIADLEWQEQQLRQKIAQLQASQNQILSDQLTKTQATIQQMLQEGLSELEQRKQALLISVEQLERRRERIRTEMRTTFAGVSQELAIRVQGFKDYLVGSLQDLVVAAEQLELAEPTAESFQPRMDEPQPPASSPTPKFAEQAFQDQIRQIRDIIDQYRKMPDYYGPPWQLRRTFEPIHGERVSNWFFTQGGRGAIRTIGSRLQNILVASAVMSVLRTLYGDRLRTLVLANSPERLGEWRRGLQDCLGISRSDFGPERGVVLFEEASALVQKADRLMTQKQLPLIIVDETEDQIRLSILQFPLWLAFAPDPQQMNNY